MGAHHGKNLDSAVHRAETRSGKMSVTGRYHKLPKKLEDDYKPLSTVLGSGYNGSVFLAESATTGAKFAVKGFKLHGISANKRAELENEVEIFLGMDHPHVARLNDVYESSDSLQLVMECMTGGELFKRVVAKKKFSEKDAADAAWQMLLALSYIHSHGIVHRDIKLENYLYDKEDSNHLKLIDFGFSKVWAPNTKLHLSCGTLAYVAPEVLEQNYTSSCDLWSYGVTVFILLFGYMPFSGSEQRQITNIKGGKYTKKQEPWSKVSQPAQDFIEKLLVVDTKKRLTADAALKHAWIVQRDQMESGQHVDQGIADALVSFGQASHFRRACMEMMAWSLTNDERAQVRDAFLALDKDRSGAISLQEFKQVLEQQFHITDEKAIQAFAALDVNHHDEIHYTDFLAAMVSSRIKLHDDLLKATFHRFDDDNCGFITAEDLRKVLGEAFEGEDIEHLMQEAHAVGGKLSLEAFMAFLKQPDAEEKHVDAAARIIDKQASAPDNVESRAPTVKSKATTAKKQGAPNSMTTEAPDTGEKKAAAGGDGCCSLQ
jgi:calcium-dependent protein kinase